MDLKILMNGGTEFLDDMNDQNDKIFSSIWAYHQEEVFSLITDYEHDKFGEQEKEYYNYYVEIASIAKKKSCEVFFLEYTTDEAVKDKITNFCSQINITFIYFKS